MLLTTRGLRKLFDTTFDYAFEAGERSGRMQEVGRRVSMSAGSKTVDFLDSFFGKHG